ncbi:MULTISPECIES: hypothetical protein [Thermomonosporaceae]|nr:MULTISPECIES: hypothetical protein [Thermomonosporaceae]MDL4770597.1 hypothetical protein [Actinomadura xylanilytica]
MLGTLRRPAGGAARVFDHDVVREADAVRAGGAGPGSAPRCC